MGNYHYQDHDSKEWLIGTVKDFQHNEIVVNISNGGEKRVHPCRTKRYFEEIISESDEDEKNFDMKSQKF